MSKSLGKVTKCDPFVVEKIWGGDKLSGMKGISCNSPVGETWEVAALREGSSSVGADSLSDYYDDRTLPYVVKFIDTTDYLSVQVHPDDSYARAHENSNGKTECWLILEAEPGACLYLGFMGKVGAEEFRKSAKSGDDLSGYLWKHEVKKGDFFYVPAGSVHAIGPGILLAEVQQACGVTYRVWDWNRVDESGKGRELHIDKAMDVLNFDPCANTPDTFMLRHNLFENEGVTNVVEHHDFKVQLVRGKQKVKLESRGRPGTVIFLQGSGKVDHLESKTWDTFLVSEETPVINIELSDDALALVVT